MPFPDSDDGRPLYSRRQSDPEAGDRSSDSSPSKRRPSLLILSLGLLIALFLLLLAFLALKKYFFSSSSSSSSLDASGVPAIVTETITLSGGSIVTTTVTKSAPKATRTDTTSSSEKGATGGSSSGATSGSAASGGSNTLPGASRNNIGIGFLPDYKDTLMSDITKGLGIKSSFYGWRAFPEHDRIRSKLKYALLRSHRRRWTTCTPGRSFSAPILSDEYLLDSKACECIFQPAVMPTKGWAGLTASDDSQAKAIAAVMKKFTDEGIELTKSSKSVRQYSRLDGPGHALTPKCGNSWYVTDGTYQGGVSDFKAAWAVVAKAVADNPKVKMFYTPNVAASLDDYISWYPDDPSTVDYLGIGEAVARMSIFLLDLLDSELRLTGTYYYPRDASQSFLEHMQPLYDKYCKDGSTKFAIGETGNGWAATIDERLAWLDQTTSAETAKAMPHYVGIAWFTYFKEQDFRLWIKGDDKVNSATKAWLAGNDIVASGAPAGNA
ncbi:hypothetical protein BMF94_4165 [Rhodotorula taiwanensis]|uniref:GH26 domain-containing protein n=1 Tax=Rhodotorula taiwanensis TaxID=741276 RepID=A0A2S5B7L3_9BASI|nr:hypothetical protein BMF94_4165 [Rhodotorula taiwanensis]